MEKLSAKALAAIVRRVVRAVRGSSSQTDLARRLGKSHDAVSRWESGATSIRWSDFCQLLEATMPSGTEPLLVAIRAQGPLADWSSVVAGLAGPISPQQLSERLPISLSIARRWLKPGADPALVECFAAIDELLPSVFVPFLANIVDLSADPDLADRFFSERQRSLGQVATPIGMAVHTLLEQGDVAAQPSSPRRLAERLGVPPDAVEAALTAMLQIGCVQVKDGRYTADEAIIESALSDRRKNVQAKIYWMQRAIQGFSQVPDQSLPPDNQFGYLMFSSSDGTYEQISKLLKSFYNQVVDLLQHNGKSDEQSLRLMGLHLFDERFLAQFPEAESLPVPLPAPLSTGFETMLTNG